MDKIEERRKQVLQLNRQGKRQVEIAKILGVSQSVISSDVKILRKQGKILSKDEELEQIKMQILQLNKQGKNQEEIVQILGISKKVVSKNIKILKNQGFDIINYQKMPRTLIDERRKKVLQLNEQGKNQKEIAQILDISQSKVSYDIKILKSQGYNIVNPKRVIKIPKEVEERRKKVLQLNEQGKRQVEIAKILGVSQSIISEDIKILKQQGNTIIKVKTIKKTSKEVEERRKKILQLNKQGKSQKEIAKILKVSQSLICDDIRELKLQGYNIIDYRKNKTKLLEKKLKNNTYSKLNIDKLCRKFYGQPKILQKFNEYISYCKEEFKQGTLPKEELDRIKKSINYN